MRYKVSVNYTDFIFENGQDAITFANIAIAHIDEVSKRVTIDIIEHVEDEEDDAI